MFVGLVEWDEMLVEIPIICREFSISFSNYVKVSMIMVVAKSDGRQMAIPSCLYNNIGWRVVVFVLMGQDSKPMQSYDASIGSKLVQ